MVLFERAITELSSFTASVTLHENGQLLAPNRYLLSATHIKELGFFFFFKIAVEVSSSCIFRQFRGFCKLSRSIILTSFFSAPEASLGTG